jgi:hypothetical protein
MPVHFCFPLLLDVVDKISEGPLKVMSPRSPGTFDDRCPPVKQPELSAKVGVGVADACQSQPLLLAERYAKPEDTGLASPRTKGSSNAKKLFSFH